MSLKAFHIVFIIASTLLAFFFGAWELAGFFGHPGGTALDLVMGIGSVICGVALIVYGRIVLKKLRHISYM